MPYTISNEQREILNLLTQEFLTPKQIATRRQTTIYAVYKTIRKLKKKGHLKGGYKNAFKNRGVTKSQGVQKLRLHNIQESVKILESSKFYERLRQKKNKLALDGLTIMLYKDSVQLFTQEYISFYGKTTNECYSNAIKFFSRFYTLIENDYKIVIEKNRVLNKKWVRQHIALTNSEIAKQANEEKQPIIIKDKEDGKQRIITDNSFNLNELETVHPIKAKKDMDLIKIHVEDMINNPSLTNSQLSSRINDLIGLAAVERENIAELHQTLKHLIELILKK